MPAFCAACGGGLDDNARFCTGCGAVVAQPTPAASEAPTMVSEPATANGVNGNGPQPTYATATAEPPSNGHAAAGMPDPALGQPTAQMPPVAAAPSYVAPPPPPPLPPAYYAAPQQPLPSGGGTSKGLIAGLAAALALVIAGVVVAVLLASGGSSSTPTVAAAPAAASTAAPANVTTVTRIIERPAKKSTSSSSSSSSKSTLVKASSTPTVHRTASTSSFTDKAEIRGVLQRHWSAIGSGNYSAAFALLVPGTQSESAWISAHEQDALTDESLSLGTPSLTSSTTATVPVTNLHTDAASGCFNWSGYYEMQKVSGDWRIGKAKISRSAC